MCYVLCSGEESRFGRKVPLTHASHQQRLTLALSNIGGCTTFFAFGHPMLVGTEALEARICEFSFKGGLPDSARLFTSRPCVDCLCVVGHWALAPWPKNCQASPK
ncbi:unnamed protein product [Symbiodinium natans]|uniref:Uncharacterized protein n=1 Tax=Symbiodinium natans TaxID=878477 RepID=A0A812SKU5_9DINO|nr:unnamed protein product [Symbiodinium natans]